MDHAFRFILEEPNSGPSKGHNNRKRARLVTACDNCRLKKIKCTRTTQSVSESVCDACRLSGADCSYGDRDRYQNEKGVPFIANVMSVPKLQMETNGAEIKSKRRKMSAASSPTGTSLYELENTTDASLPPSRASDTPLTPTPPLSLSAAQHTAHREPVPSIVTELSSKEEITDNGLRRITVPFFRYFGPTANTPGYRRVKVRTLTLTDVGSPQSSPSDTVQVGSYEGESAFSRLHGAPPGNSSAGSPPTLNNSRTSPSATSSLFDSTRSRYPSPLHLPHLAGLFFDHLACHFPFLERTEVIAAVENETFPAILANCIASLACRFSDRAELLKPRRHAAGEAYSDMAKLLVVHMLSWPSLEVLQALILIAWSEFGSGRDSGLWMYSRMAVAMAVDLGLHVEATVQLAATELEREKVRATWWSVVMIDRINSWGTGRPIAIGDDQFDTALPAVRVDVHEDINNPPHPSLVFGHLASLVQLRGRMGDVLNSLVKRNAGMLGSLEIEMTQLQYEMTTWYQSLAPSLAFNIQNFRRFALHNQSSIFLLLHCMFHSVITLLHRPSLLQSFTPDVALPLANSIDVSRSSARSLVDMVSFADEIDSNALVANPFLDLPILTAARAFLAEREFLAKPPANMTPMAVLLMREWSEASLDRCKDALKKMSRFWGGVGCVKRILDQQSAGELDFDVGEGSGGDHQISHIRDVELITKWATSQWRRNVGQPRGDVGYQGSGSGSIPRQPTSFGSLVNGIDNTVSAPLGSSPQNGSNILAPYLHDSPAGASVGITGMLDGAFSSYSHYGGNMRAPDDGALRVSFNSAEADLSFPNLNSTELFSIPEGFEEFLGSTMLVDQALSGNHSSDLRAVASSLLGDMSSSNGTTNHDLSTSFPAFSTLIGPWFPMGQFQSRAPSPGVGI